MELSNSSEAAEITFRRRYELVKQIGRGSYGDVYKAKDTHSGHFVAIKHIEKHRLRSKDLDHLKQELKILHFVRPHPNTVTVKEVYQFPQKGIIYVVMELLEGGSLLTRIMTPCHTLRSEEDCRVVITSLAKTLAYCHSHGIVHRDLKPENILFPSSKGYLNAKIADFGLAQILKKGETSKTLCGTQGYIAPEVLSGQPYRTACDIWSLGVIMYILLVGSPPFFHVDPHVEMQYVCRGLYAYPTTATKAISKDAKNLIARMLTVSQFERITAEDVLRHPWLTPHIPAEVSSRQRVRSGSSHQPGILTLAHNHLETRQNTDYTLYYPYSDCQEQAVNSRGPDYINSQRQQSAGSSWSPPHFVSQQASHRVGVNGFRPDQNVELAPNLPVSPGQKAHRARSTKYPPDTNIMGSTEQLGALFDGLEVRDAPLPSMSVSYHNTNQEEREVPDKLWKNRAYNGGAVSTTSSSDSSLFDGLTVYSGPHRH